ncbi:phenolic acid decarboxylase subunit C [archaeon BMS3Abin16]|nr:phenolic acid decarboxylase subunit C [archaeon BMS3Abin16]
MDLRSFIGKPEVRRGRSVDFEIARDLFENPGKTLLFQDVPGYKFDVVGNVITCRDDVYQALGTNREDYIEYVTQRSQNPVEPVVIDSGACQEEECSLSDIPVIRHFEKDGGRYITSGIVVAKDPEYGCNVSIHRMLVRDDGRIGIRIVPRHLRSFMDRAEARGEDLEIAIAIGVDPRVFYAASYSPRQGYDEFSFAGAIMDGPLELVKCRTVDIEVPAHAEFVIEGRILAGLREPEGPFADVTGTYDRVRDEPVIEVTKVTHRRGAVYQALLPASIEHRLFMGMPREPGIYSAVSEVAEVKYACLTNGGKNWLHGVVSLSKTPDDVKSVIEHAFEGHKSMKHVVIVNDDIDIFNSDEIEYAISTRFQAHRDTYVYRNMRGSTLDPSTDEDGLTTKVGIDATIPPGREPEYEFAKIPGPKV